jgi:Clr5 domain
MAETNKIHHDEEWNMHKAKLYSLYITENKTLDQVIECAACDYGFRPRFASDALIQRFQF